MTLSARLRPAILRAHLRLVPWGIDGQRAVSRVRGIKVVRSELEEFERQRKAAKHPDEFPLGRAYPIYEDRYASAGIATGHYFHQDLIVARDIHARRPRRHIDVGSSVYGFVSHVASFRELEVFDVRPLKVDVPGITFVRQDVMAIGHQWDGVADSVSCLHALEHFGLGRYGDPVDYDGWRKGLVGLTRLLEPGGRMYLSVPTGEHQRVEFNAHRVFSIPFLREVLAENFEIERLAFVDDAGDLVPDLDPFGTDAENSLGADYGCGIWFLRKKQG